jgi:guanylate kinase
VLGVVVDPPGAEVVVVVVAMLVVVVLDCATAAEPSNDAKIEKAIMVVAANPSVDRLRRRIARRECPSRNDVKFMPAPRCLNA